jgi:hypothetical protein
MQPTETTKYLLETQGICKDEVPKKTRLPSKQHHTGKLDQQPAKSDYQHL